MRQHSTEPPQPLTAKTAGGGAMVHRPRASLMLRWMLISVLILGIVTCPLTASPTANSAARAALGSAATLVDCGAKEAQLFQLKGVPLLALAPATHPRAGTRVLTLIGRLVLRHDPIVLV